VDIDNNEDCIERDCVFIVEDKDEEEVVVAEDNVANNDDEKLRFVKNCVDREDVEEVVFLHKDCIIREVSL
jgi:hypothetical protein